MMELKSSISVYMFMIIIIMEISTMYFVLLLFVRLSSSVYVFYDDVIIITDCGEIAYGYHQRML